MARAHIITRGHRTKQGKNRRNQHFETPHKHQNIKILSRCHTKFRKVRTQPFQKRDNMRQLLKEGTKWDWTTDRNTDFNKLKQELTKLPCLAHYNGNRENIVTTKASKTGLRIALWKKQGSNELKPIAFASRNLNDDEKILNWRIKTISRGLETGKI